MYEKYRRVQLSGNVYNGNMNLQQISSSGESNPEDTSFCICRYNKIQKEKKIQMQAFWIRATQPERQLAKKPSLESTLVTKRLSVSRTAPEFRSQAADSRKAWGHAETNPTVLSRNVTCPHCRRPFSVVLALRAARFMSHSLLKEAKIKPI